MFHWKDLVLLNLISRCMTSTNEQFSNSKDIVYLCKKIFLYQKVIYQCNSCRAHILGGVIIYLYMCKYIFPCVSCICLSLLVVSNQSNCKKHVIGDKPVVNSMPCCIKHSKVLLVLRYRGSTSLGP